MKTPIGWTSLIAVCLFFKWEVGRLLYLCDCKSNPPFTVPPLKKQVSFCFDNTVR